MANPNPPLAPRWKPGQSGNPKGRKPGPIAKTLEARAFARRIVEDRRYRASLRKRAIAGELGLMEKELWHYAYGRPKVEVELGGLLEFSLQIGDDDDARDNG